MESRKSVQVLDRLPAGVLVTDVAGVIVYANQKSEAILHRSRDQLLGFRLKEILPGMAAHLTVAETRLEEDHQPRCVYKQPDNGDITIGFQIARTGFAEASPGAEFFTVLFQDITGFERLRDERDRLLQLAAVGEVLPGILHELKNPMAAITTAVEVLIEEVPEGYVQTELHAILSEVRRMKLAFEGIGLLDLTMCTRKATAIDFAIEEAFRVLEAQMKRNRIVSRCDIQPLPLLYLDPAAIRAIVFNLVNNAIHACKAGDEISVEASLVDHDRVFKIIIRDTGIGMNQETLRRCRELFFTSKPNGSGMGLALCETVVKRAQGKLLIESREGIGTQVTVLLPVPVPRQPSLGTPLSVQFATTTLESEYSGGRKNVSN